MRRGKKSRYDRDREDERFRPAAVAGTFYPARRDELLALVKSYLGEVEAEPAPAIAAVVPHAGLIYSGRCAARVFARVDVPEVVVLIGPDHFGAGRLGGASLWGRGAFETPLGRIPVSESFSRRLADRCEIVTRQPHAHLREHAIEVELPFLSVVAPETSIVPVLLSFDGWRSSAELASVLADLIREGRESVCVVASSDMTHYESAITARRKDSIALAEIERLDGRALLESCRREGITMCGRAAVATAIEVARLLGSEAAEVVDYRHSGLVTGDDSSVVAYAGVIVR